MPSLENIQPLLETLSQILGPKRVVGVRTDYFVTDQGASRRCLVIERHHKGTKYAILSPREGLRERGIRSLVSWLGLTPDQANAALEAAHSLSEINDIGAWPLMEDMREAVVLSSEGVNGERWSKFPGFRQRFNSIRDLLRDAAVVRFLAHTGQNAGGQSRKGWIHIYDHDGAQRMAASTNSMIGALRSWYGPEDDEHASADARLGRWAHQMGVGQDDFLDAAMTLMQMDNVLGATELDLRQEA